MDCKKKTHIIPDDMKFSPNLHTSCLTNKIVARCLAIKLQLHFCTPAANNFYRKYITIAT